MEKLYTLEEAKKIIEEENRQKTIRKTIRKERKKAEKRYYFKQKLSGLLFAIIGIISVFLCGNILYCTFIMPISLYIIFTKEKVMMF